MADANSQRLVMSAPRGTFPLMKGASPAVLVTSFPLVFSSHCGRKPVTQRQEHRELNVEVFSLINLTNGEENFFPSYSYPKFSHVLLFSALQYCCHFFKKKSFTGWIACWEGGMTFYGSIFQKPGASFQASLNGFIKSASTSWFTLCFSESCEACEVCLPSGPRKKFKS